MLMAITAFGTAEASAIGRSHEMLRVLRQARDIGLTDGEEAGTTYGHRGCWG